MHAHISYLQFSGNLYRVHTYTHTFTYKHTYIPTQLIHKHFYVYDTEKTLTKNNKNLKRKQNCTYKLTKRNTVVLQSALFIFFQLNLSPRAFFHARHNNSNKQPCYVSISTRNISQIPLFSSLYKTWLIRLQKQMMMKKVVRRWDKWISLYFVLSLSSCESRWSVPWENMVCYMVGITCTKTLHRLLSGSCHLLLLYSQHFCYVGLSFISPFTILALCTHSV